MSAYKKENDEWKAVMKISNNPAKITTPGIKQVWRLYNKDGSMKADVISLKEEIIESGIPYTFYHPDNEWQFFKFNASSVKPLLKEYIKNGSITQTEPTLKEIKAFAMSELELLDATSKRLLNPHIYKVSLTEKTKALKIAVLKEIK